MRSSAAAPCSLVRLCERCLTRDAALQLLAGAGETSGPYRKATFARVRWAKDPDLARVIERVARLTGLPADKDQDGHSVGIMCAPSARLPRPPLSLRV